jgi:hypothetical protein
MEGNLNDFGVSRTRSNKIPANNSAMTATRTKTERQPKVSCNHDRPSKSQYSQIDATRLRSANASPVPWRMPVSHDL